MKRAGRGMLASALAVGLAGVLSAPPASATVIGGYNIYSRSGAAYQAGKTNILPSSGTSDDVVVNMSTTATGARKLPFAISFYGQTYTTISVSSNGNIQFGGTGSTAYYPSCLPTSTFARPTLAVLWEDLIFDPSIGEGIFVKTSGTTGHKSLVISWRGRHFGDNTFARAEVIFTQGRTGFVTNYAVSEGSGATIGVQGTSSGPYSQWQCANSGGSENTGDQLAFAYYG